MVEWEKGNTTIDPLYIIAADDTVTCDLYIDDNFCCKSRDGNVSDQFQFIKIS